MNIKPWIELHFYNSNKCYINIFDILLIVEGTKSDLWNPRSVIHLPYDKIISVNESPEEIIQLIQNILDEADDELIKNYLLTRNDILHYAKKEN